MLIPCRMCVQLPGLPCGMLIASSLMAVSAMSHMRKESSAFSVDDLSLSRPGASNDTVTTLRCPPGEFMEVSEIQIPDNTEIVVKWRCSPMTTTTSTTASTATSTMATTTTTMATTATTTTTITTTTQLPTPPPCPIRRAHAGTVYFAGSTVAYYSGYYPRGTKHYPMFDVANGSTSDVICPVEVVKGVSSIWAGEFQAFFRAYNGTILAMGSNNNGQLGDGTRIDRTHPTPTSINGINGWLVKEIVPCEFRSLFLLTNGTAYIAGANGTVWANHRANGLQTHEHGNFQLRAVMSDVKAVACAKNYSFFLARNGSLFGTGNLVWHQEHDFKDLHLIMQNVQSVAAGWYHALFLLEDGTVRGYGQNWAGQLGDGTTTSFHRDILGKTLQTGIQAVSAGLRHSLYLTENGSAYLTGAHQERLLRRDGKPAVETQLTPKFVLPNVTRVVAGYSRSFFYTKSHTFLVTGICIHGDCGTGSSEELSLPQPILENVMDVGVAKEATFFLGFVDD